MEKVKCPLCKMRHHTKLTVIDDWDKICHNCLSEIEDVENKLKGYDYD